MSIGILAMVNHTALRIINNEMRSKRFATNWTLDGNFTLDFNVSHMRNESSVNRRWANGHDSTPIGSANDQCPDYVTESNLFVSLLCMSNY